MGGKENLPTNYNIAERRLISLVKDLEVKGYFGKYPELFQVWEKDRMIEEVLGRQH